MYDFTTVKRNLEERDFAVSCFATAAEAADYLAQKLDGKTVGHGGSLTLKEMGLLERLVNGPWEDEEFLVCPPGHRIIASNDERKIAAEPRKRSE